MSTWLVPLVTVALSLAAGIAIFVAAGRFMASERRHPRWVAPERRSAVAVPSGSLDNWKAARAAHAGAKLQIARAEWEAEDV